jgi:hypothetical protein
LRQFVWGKKVIRATDAKEVGVENPSEETFCRPDQENWCPVNLPKNPLNVNQRLENYPVNNFFP